MKRGSKRWGGVIVTLKDTFIYCHERFKCKANGAQKLECTQST